MTSPKKPRRKKPTKAIDDPWVTKFSVIDPAKLHALGVITAGWNSCEIHLIALFVKVVNLEPHPAWIVAHDLGDIALSERIYELAKSRCENGELDIDVVDGLKSLLKVYDLCRQNRNLFTHSKLEIGEDGTRRIVRMKGPSMIRHALPSDLSDFRRVAEEISSLLHAIHLMWRAVEERNLGRRIPLPKIPPPPELLWKPHPANSIGTKPQPPASRP